MRIFTLSLSLFFLAHLQAQHIDRSYPDSLNRQRLAWTLGGEAAFYVGGMSYLSFVWYKDQERVPFHWYNDNAGYLQIDKMGHAYAAYAESLLGYQALRRAGMKPSKAIWIGGSLGFILQAPIEVFDGIYEGWGFSWGDIAANTAGSALVIGQELLFQEQVLRYNFSFWRSPYADQAHGYLGDNFLESLFYDYNGHTYWLSMPINRILPASRLPDWLCISAGYSANGMFGEFENRRSWRGQPIPETQRYRQFLFSLDIDSSKIQTRRRWLRILLDGLAFVKVPFPAIEINTLGKVRGYGAYF